MRILSLLFLFFLHGCLGREIKKPDLSLKIAVSANMQFAMREIAAVFEKKEGIKVEMMIGASGKLTSQILNDAPFHLFVAADTLLNNKIIEAGKGVPNQYIYAIGSLVLWTTRSHLKGKDLFNVLKEKDGIKISLPNPATAPYGFQAKLALENAGLWELVSPDIVTAESIAQATQYVYSGICEMGFTAKSVLFAPELKGTGFWEEVPAYLYEPIYQGFIVTKRGQQENGSAATLFSTFMKSQQVREILLKNGYTLP